MVVRAHRTDLIISAGKHIDDIGSDGIFTRPRRDTRLDEDTVVNDTGFVPGPEIRRRWGTYCKFDDGMSPETSARSLLQRGTF
jgi:hypothetical protein